MDKKCRLVFFSSGDFPYWTIEQVLKLDLYDVVGIVTSEYKSITIGSTIEDLANKYKIPCLKIHKNSELKNDKTLSWLKEKNADIFCVISFKYLPNEILSIPKITSFNVHASLLPFLRGAAPIYWAIRHGFKYTGLTSFVLNDCIDSGEIISNIRIPIDENETYGTLHKKLSVACIGFTVETISHIYRHNDWRRNLILQPDCGILSKYMKAPKLKSEYLIIDENFSDYINDDGLKNIYALFRALSPYIGCKANLSVYQKYGSFHKTYDIKIYNSELLDKNEVNYEELCKFKKSPHSNIITDGKTFMYFAPKYTNKMISIKEIQISGKKKMNIKDFLAGLQYARMDDMYLIIY